MQKLIVLITSQIILAREWQHDQSIWITILAK